MELMLGAPGTGKTTKLVEIIKEQKPNKFALLTFTRQAASEAKFKLSALYNEKDLDWVRTIHSLAFKVLKLKRGQMFTDRHLKHFGEVTGFQFGERKSYEEDDSFDQLTEDDITYRFMQTCVAQRNVKFADMKIPQEINPTQLAEMYVKYGKYKEINYLLDFNDILMLTLVRPLPMLDLLLVDEVQDLSPLQFAIIRKLWNNSKKTILAGDDDQMIYEWAGVDREEFMRIAKRCDIATLDRNWRLPLEIGDVANKTIERCKDRIDKKIITTKGSMGGSVIRSEEFIDPVMFANPHKTFLVLARNAWFLKEIREQITEMGYKYSFLKIGERDARIQLSTIHGSKGAEADIVVLFTDVTGQTYENITRDSEHRVWYVGMTRARHQLIIVGPRTGMYYDI